MHLGIKGSTMAAYYCGIDAGSLACKLVVIDSQKAVIHKSMSRIGGDPAGTVQQMHKQALKTLNIKDKAAELEITGRNGEDVIRSRSPLSEYVCITTGACHCLPDLYTIVDCGGFTNKALRVEKGKIIDYMVNDICSSGSGIFLELVAKSLDISLEEMATLALGSANVVPITSQCSIFAESEVIYLMNEGKSVADISRGVCQSIIGRIVPLVSKLRPKEPIILTGGVAKSPAVRHLFEATTGLKLSSFDFDPQFFTAYGAALLAMQPKAGKQ